MNQTTDRKRHTRGRCVAALLAGVGLGLLLAAGCAIQRPAVDYSLLAQAADIIQQEYVDQPDTKSKALTYGAIAGMVDALGDTGHSTFLTPKMVTQFKERTKGEFKGIGVEIQIKDQHVTIVAPIDGSPAQKAGLRAGEIILKVDGNEVAGWPASQVSEAITGPAGTSVQLTVLNPKSGRTRELAIVRAAIKFHDVTWHGLPGTDLVDLRLAGFDAGAAKELRTALAAIQSIHAKGIVLDLRNNPGGFLDEAIGVASQFLRTGTVLQVKNAKGKVTPVPVRKEAFITSLPVVVLVNKGTASAAEIVAAALQDANRAQLVGETTFGTGTVLSEFRLSDGSALLLAIEEWLTPAGRSFWHKGLKPGIPVELTPEATPLIPSAEEDLTAEALRSSSDVQLLRAIELLQQETARPAPH